MNAPTIKICGITNTTDATAAAQASADYLGLIFVPGTPRFVSMETAQWIVNSVRVISPSAKFVGVFQDATRENIQTHLSALPLDAVQLHGQESPEFCAGISAPVIKTLLIQPECDLAELAKRANTYLAMANIKNLLLDLPKGGSVKTILDFPEQSELRRFLADFPCWLAGGLNPDHVQQVLSTLRPKGVDVASGVEQSVGQKDPKKMADFCQAVKSFPIQRNQGDERLCNL